MKDNKYLIVCGQKIDVSDYEDLFEVFTTIKYEMENDVCIKICNPNAVYCIENEVQFEIDNIRIKE